MRKFIVFPDSSLIGKGSRDELSPLTFEEFDKYDHWRWESDSAFDHFLRHNHFHELSRYNEDALKIGEIVLELGEPTIDWSILYGDHNCSECMKCKSR